MGTLIRAPFVDAAVVLAGGWNAHFDTWIAEFNGKLDNLNFKAGANINGAKLKPNSIVNSKLAASLISDTKLNYDAALGVKVCRTSAVALRRTVGIEDFTLAAGVATGTIVFATESNIQSPAALDPTPFNLGDPAFSVAPRIALGIQHSGGVERYDVRITAKSNTQFSYKITSSSVGDTSSGKLHWEAIASA